MSCLPERIALGIELGSTRIKAVLIDAATHQVIATGGHAWENRLENGVWTYPLTAVDDGVKAAFADLVRAVGQPLQKIDALGVSAMMHGYLAFDDNNELLVPFRTWRNTSTERASKMLTEAIDFHLPQRWSASHFFQAILDKEAHIPDVYKLNTLAGYVHERLTGQFVLGVGDASGMFPIDPSTGDYDVDKIAIFDKMTAAYGIDTPLYELLPCCLQAGEDAGSLSTAGALYLDPTGALLPGTPCCPPEGDAGTGMVATHAVAPKTGNVSAGTSIFAMIVLEKPLSKVYHEIDMVATPSGAPVAMVHCTSCTSDLNQWIQLFGAFAKQAGHPMTSDELYGLLYRTALSGDADGGGLLSYNCFSGEPVAGIAEGRPLLTRLPDADFTLPNFMRTLLNAAVSTLALGMRILTDENVAIDSIVGHGGFFRTKGVGQRILAAALHAPVTVMDTADEGGAWGIALLAAYALNRTGGQSLPEYLDQVFESMPQSILAPNAEDVQGFAAYLHRYQQGIPIENAAGEWLK